jgi:DNA-binding NarL/FixJ family response regulator
MRTEPETLALEDPDEAAVRRLLVVDDSKPLRDAVQRLMTGVPGWEICGEATNGREAIEKALTLRPDIILMDVGMPEMDGLEATRHIRRQVDAEVLIFTQYDSRQAWEEAVDAGARGYLAKSQASNLVQALEAVVEHRDYSGVFEKSTANGSARY